jgi:hypothetical protein
MSKIRWLLAALGVALVSLVPVLGRPPRQAPTPARFSSSPR